jgi:hypothetical protein
MRNTQGIKIVRYKKLSHSDRLWPREIGISLEHLTVPKQVNRPPSLNPFFWTPRNPRTYKMLFCYTECHANGGRQKACLEPKYIQREQLKRGEETATSCPIHYPSLAASPTPGPARTLGCTTWQIGPATQHQTHQTHTLAGTSLPRH